MAKRTGLLKVDPKAYQAMLAMEKYLTESPLKKVHRELIKIRVSQINGCAFCLNMHTRDARAAGETEQRIYLLNAWKESRLFTEEEKALLALSEQVTLIAGHGVSDEVYDHAVQVLGEPYTAAVVMAAIAINGWNRIGITYELPLD